MRRFRIDVVGKLEDRPRLLRAYGRVKGAEIALVLRPLEYRGMLLRHTRSGAQQWLPEGQNVPVDWPRARVRTDGRAATVLDGPLTGELFDLQQAAPPTCSVALDRVGRTAIPTAGDAPRAPTVEVESRDAIRAIKRMQTNVGTPGPVTFRGHWAGTLVCDEGVPVVELRRKLASYGWLRISSGPTGWSWRFERDEKWFSTPEASGDEHFATLVQAIDAGTVGALGLVQMACRVRDTTRRQALDPSWAAARPIPRPRPTSNPMDRLVEPVPAEPKPPRKRNPAPRKRKPPARKSTSNRPTRKKTAPKAKPPRKPAAPQRAAATRSAPVPPNDDALLAAFSEAVASALQE